MKYGVHINTFIFGLIILSKIILIQYFCVSSVYLNPFHHKFLTYLAFWLPKIAAAMLVTAPISFFQRKSYSVCWMLLLDLWMVANLIYFRANDLLLSLDAIRMAGNLDGFSSSILTYLHWDVWIFPLLTLMYSFSLLFLKPNSSWQMGMKVVCIGIICSLLGSTCNFLTVRLEKKCPFSTQWFNPFRTPDALLCETWVNDWQQLSYLMQHSILAYFGNMFVIDKQLRQVRQYPQPKNDYQKAFLANLPDIRSVSLSARYNLILIVVESLESWVFEIQDTNGIDVMQNTLAFCKRYPNFYVPRIKSQIRDGVSGDGQMTINTGLLPISSGAACLLYNNNSYPNFGHFYPQSAIVSPVRHAWNQSDATRNYGYKNLITPKDRMNSFTQNAHRVVWNDSIIFEQTEHWILQSDTTFSVMSLTMGSHSPFWLSDDNFALQWSEVMPKEVQRYCNCLHYTDYYIGKLLHLLEDSGLFKNSVIAITGDHIIFRNTMFKDLQTWARTTGLSVANETNYCPLLLFSPNVKINAEREDICYQMDIFPTLLNVIGCNDYPWRGFGINLLDTLPRSFSEQQAYELSDLLIRMNAFRK